jgi:WD40 repeat protein
MSAPRTVCLLVGFLSGLPLAAQPAAPEGRAEAALQKLSDRFADVKADREKLRQDLQTLRRTFAGTPQAVGAADLLRQLPSALDPLDSSAIRPLEKFPWQPKELVAVLGEHRGRQGAAASCVAYSPDRTFVASGGGHLVRLWQTDPQRLLRLIVNLSAPNVASVAIAPDSKRLAAGGNGMIYLHDLEGPNSKLRVAIPAGSVPITAIAFHPKGKPILACGSYDTKLRLFDLDKQDPLAMEICLLAGHRQSVNALAFAPDGAYLASGSGDGTVRLWKVEGAKTEEASKIETNAKGINTIAYSKDGRVLAAGGADGTIWLWNIAGSKTTARATFAAHESAAATALAFSPSGQTLTSAGSDRLIRHWDVMRKVPTKSAELKGHGGPVTGVAYSPDGRTLASSGQDWTVRLWDVATRRERVPPDGHLSAPYSLAFSPDGTTLASGGEDRFIKLWSAPGQSPKERIAFQGSDYQVDSLAYAPDGKTLAGGDANGTVQFWSLATSGRPQPAARPLKDLPGYVTHLAYLPDGGRLLVQHYNTAALYDVRTGRRVHRFEADPQGKGLVHVALAPDGSRVAGASGYYLMKGNDYVKNQDGSYAYFDCSTRLWDTESGKLLQQAASKLPVYTSTFSPDGRRLLSGVWEPVLHFYDVAADGIQNPARVETGAGQVYRIQFSPDGRCIVTQDTANHVIVWDAASRRKRHDWGLPEHVSNVAFAPDSRHLAMSLATGVIYILRLDGPAGGRAK